MERAPDPLDTRALLRQQSRAHARRHGARWQDGLEALAARTGSTPRAVVGLLLVALLVLVVLGGRVLLVRRATHSVPVASVASVAPDASAGPVASDAAPSTSAGTTVPSPVVGGTAPALASPGGPGAVVVVDVVGQVHHQGVVRLPVGSRVEAAVEAAGGARAAADLTSLNLARVLQDGEQVVVPRHGQLTTAPAPAPAGSAPTTAPTGPVDLNTADATALDALPGVGPVLAARIVDWRTQHGRFGTVDELGEVSGIGAAILGRLRPLVTVS